MVSKEHDFLTPKAPELTLDALIEARAILERENFVPAGRVFIPVPNLMIPDWLIHGDYRIEGEVVNVTTT